MNDVLVIGTREAMRDAGSFPRDTHLARVPGIDRIGVIYACARGGNPDYSGPPLKVFAWYDGTRVRYTGFDPSETLARRWDQGDDDLFGIRGQFPWEFGRLAKIGVRALRKFGLINPGEQEHDSE